MLVSPTGRWSTSFQIPGNGYFSAGKAICTTFDHDGYTPNSVIPPSDLFRGMQ